MGSIGRSSNSGFARFGIRDSRLGIGDSGFGMIRDSGFAMRDERFGIRDQGSRIARLFGMARGWESKNIESQQEEAERQRPKGPAPTADQLVRLERQRALELTRKRVTHDLQRAAAPAHRKMLQSALDAIDAELATLQTR